MKKITIAVISIIIVVLVSIGVLSQAAPVKNIISKISQITPSISLDKRETCTTSSYDIVEDVYGQCVYYHNYTHCINSSGPNTECSLEHGISNFRCKTGRSSVTKENTECKPNDEFIISIDQEDVVLKKQIDFSDWGPCVYEEEYGCLIVTCVSIYDGAHLGKFVGCKPGMSCQRFEICDGSIKTLYRNSRDTFVEEDPSFHLNKLPLKEVPK